MGIFKNAHEPCAQVQDSRNGGRAPCRRLCVGAWGRVPCRRLCVGMFCLLAIAAPALAENCHPRWRLGPRGTDGAITVMTQFDDGDGSSIFAAGDFTQAGGEATSTLARFDGDKWSPLGFAVNGWIHAMTVHDDGRGPALYIGGQFSQVENRAARRIARWDGTNWSSVGWGVSGGDIYALKSFDDGSGSALFAAGSFRSTSGVTAHRIARWDGRSWQALRGGLTGGSAVYSLEVFRDGARDRLCAAGRFTHADGAACSNFATWDGQDWQTPEGLSGNVYAMQSYTGVDGYHLFAGGEFRSAGGGPADGLARWNGRRWSALPRGLLGGTVRSLTVMDDGNGAALYIGGQFRVAGGRGFHHLAQWDGASLRTLGAGVDGPVFALLPFQNGAEVTLFAGGSFARAGRGSAEHFARWGCSLLPDVQGDLNCDGVLDARDLAPFLLALQDRGEYRREFSDCILRNGDMDGDLDVNLGDLPLFARKLEVAQELVASDEEGSAP